MSVSRVLIVALGPVLVMGCGADRTAVQAEPVPIPAVSAHEARSLGLTRDLPEAYRRVCREHAAYAPAAARICPPLIPAGRLKVISAGRLSEQPRYRGGYLADLSSGSLSRSDRGRIATNGGHWHYDVSWTPTARRLLVRRGIEHPGAADEASSCRWSRLGGERVRACRVVPYERGGGLHGGHIAYVWGHEGVTYVISLHGYANEPRARAMTLALMIAALG